MNIPRNKPHWTRRPASPRAAERGVAVLVVMVLLAVMAAFIINNGLVLHHLKQDLRRIEQKQQRRLERPAVTNAPAVKPLVPANRS